MTTRLVALGRARRPAAGWRPTIDLLIACTAGQRHAGPGGVTGPIRGRGGSGTTLPRIGESGNDSIDHRGRGSTRSTGAAGMTPHPWSISASPTTERMSTGARARPCPDHRRHAGTMPTSSSDPPPSCLDPYRQRDRHQRGDPSLRGRGRLSGAVLAGTRRTTPFFGSSSPAVIADGGGGNDTISGSNNADTLARRRRCRQPHGMFGDDIIQGGSGDDTLSDGSRLRPARAKCGDDSISGELRQ